MHTTQRGLCIWLFAALLTGRTSAASAPEVKEALDVVYATANGEDLKLDLYTPANLKDPAPLIIYIHGGGWMGGNKAVGRVIASAMAAQGYVSATVGYRLAPKARFPAQVQDVRNAVRFFRANATKYGIDSQRVGAFGHSAGGHLSLMLGLMDPADKLAGEEPLNAESSQVQAVVNFVGPTDLTRTNWTPRIEAVLINFMGGSRETIGDRFKAASPVTYIDKDDPPILTFNGTADDVVPFDQAEVLHAALEKAGTPNQLVTIKGEGHGFRAPEALTNTLKQTQDFFAKHLKPAK